MKGDVIEVLLRDNNLNTFFKGVANINNKKQMLLLLAALKAKGVNLGKEVEIEWLE